MKTAGLVRICPAAVIMGDGLYTASRDAYRQTELSMPIATPQTVAEISSAWIEATLRSAGVLGDEHIASIEKRSIGEAQGFLSSMAVVKIKYDRPADGARRASWSS